jgi:hypothetical protein
MKHKAQIELSIRYGAYGDKSKTVVVPVSKELTHELMEGVELSNDPFSLLFASPLSLLEGRDNAVTIRERTFKMRRDVAEEIAKAIVPALLSAFGVNDKLNGYKVEELSEDERAWRFTRGGCDIQLQKRGAL